LSLFIVGAMMTGDVITAATMDVRGVWRELHLPMLVKRRSWFCGALLLLLAAAGAAHPSGSASGDAPAEPAPSVRGTKPPFDLETVDSAIVIVRVNQRDADTLKGRQGTGTWIGGGRILTAAHLFDAPHNEIEIFFGGRGGRPKDRRAYAVAPDRLHRFDGVDAAVLTGIEAPLWVQPPRLAGTAPAAGDVMTSVGLKSIRTRRVRTGPVMDATGDNGMFSVEYDSEEGDSGGPTFNAAGTRTETKTRTVNGQTSVVEEQSTVISTSVDLTRLKLSVR
jgi:Trypsin-like peptidase domain